MVQALPVGLNRACFLFVDLCYQNGGKNLCAIAIVEEESIDVSSVEGFFI
jgi:hypothetical protein